MRKAFILFLSLVLLLGVAPAAFAASSEATYAAESLHDLGLFQGTGTTADGTPIYDLDRKPTRNEAVTMLVRLLGKEEEAMNGTWDIPFTDVANWAKPYVGYAYANGLTKGTGATTFGGESLVTASQYITFVLRALGYESEVDFQWDKAWELSDQIGATLGEYDASSVFLRGDVAKVSLRSLEVAQKGKTETLAQKLIADGVFTSDQYSSAVWFMLPPSFGDRALHEYLISLGKSEDYPHVLGYKWNDDEYIDTYWFDLKAKHSNPNLANEITAFIKDKYYFDWVDGGHSSPHQLEPDVNLVRVEAINHKYYKEIIISTFKDGLWNGTGYFIQDGPIKMTAFGDRKIHEYLVSLNPSQVVFGALRGINFDQYWFDPGSTDLADKIGETIKGMYELERIDIIEKAPHQMGSELDAVRVETCNQNNVKSIVVLTFKGGQMYGATYVLK